MCETKELKEILAGDWHSISFTERAQNISESPKMIHKIFAFTTCSEHKLAWRSAYLLDKIHENNPRLLFPFIDKIIDEVENTQNHGVRRHFLRILSQHDLHKKVSGNFINVCFQWIQSEKVKVAVKAHAMQILYQLTEYYPELKQELKEVLISLPKNSSSGVKNRAQKLLQKL